MRYKLKRMMDIIKRPLITLSMGLILLTQAVSAGSSGHLFQATATGDPAQVNITLCLNGRGALSCQTYDVPALTLSIKSTVPNKTYLFAGIKINTPAYKIANLGVNCTPANNGYCLFAVSDTLAKTISLVNVSLPITPSTLPTAVLNTSYNQRVTASQGLPPYTYAITAGALPTGLSLNASTGRISGTPTVLGTYSFTVTATDANTPIADTGSHTYYLAVSGSLTISPSTLPPAIGNTSYNQTVTASQGLPPYTYAITAGALPTGLSLDASTGRISGTPTTAGDYNFTITSTDSALPTAHTGAKAYTLQVRVLFFSENFDSVSAGTLPTGWTVGGTGVGSDWTTVTTQFNTSPNSIFTNDPANTSDRYITSPIITIPFGTNTLSFYNYYNTENFFDGGVLEIDIGNTGTFTDIISAGGVFIQGGYNNNRCYFGSPCWTGNSGGFIQTSLTLPGNAANTNIKLRWRMRSDSSVSRQGWWVDSILLLQINDSLTISPSTLPISFLNTSYNQTVTASQGLPPYTYAITAGALPTGLSLDASTGRISGTPTTAGDYNFTITSTDSALPTAHTGAKAYTLQVRVLFFSENFDSVSAGTLPTGWTVGGTGVGSDWTTVTTQFNTSPNSIFTNDPGTTSDRYITSPIITIPVGTSTLSFYNYYNTENSFDGGVLEIDIGNTGTFTDIISAGGVFIQGGYNNNRCSFGSPCWTGDSGGFIQTSLTLPGNAANTNIKLRWRMRSDYIYSGQGWWVDSILIYIN